MSDTRIIHCDITPTTEMIYARRNDQNITATKAIGEAADNSIDAEATVIRIAVNREKETLSIWDNGKGCVDPEVMLTIGRHVPSSNRTIGRYGIGLKSAAIWLSSVTRIGSCNGTERMQIAVDWDKVAASGVWGVDAITGPCDGLAPFTYIEFQIFNDRANSQAIRRAKEALADMFSPAIESGCRIEFEGEPLRALRLPEMTNVIRHEGSFEGKPYRLTAGLLAAPGSRNGYRIAFRHRIIEDGVRKGCGYYNASRFFAYLVLDETDNGPRWQLDGHKHGFEERDALLGELFPLVEPLLQKSQETSEQVEIVELTNEIEASLAASLNPIFHTMLRPGSTHKPGPVKPTDDGPKQNNTENPGPEGGKYRAAKKRAQNLLRLHFCEFTDAPEKLGFMQRGDGGSVWINLNTLHPHVKSAREGRDVTVLRQLAATIFVADSLLLQDKQFKLPYPEMDVHNRFMAILSDALNLPVAAHQGAVNGRP